MNEKQKSYATYVNVSKIFCMCEVLMESQAEIMALLKKTETSAEYSSMLDRLKDKLLYVASEHDTKKGK